MGFMGWARFCTQFFSSSNAFFDHHQTAAQFSYHFNFVLLFICPPIQCISKWSRSRINFQPKKATINKWQANNDTHHLIRCGKQIKIVFFNENLTVRRRRGNQIALLIPGMKVVFHFESAFTDCEALKKKTDWKVFAHSNSQHCNLLRFNH